MGRGMFELRKLICSAFLTKWSRAIAQSGQCRHPEQRKAEFFCQVFSVIPRGQGFSRARGGCVVVVVRWLV